jgi:hypothetical protein
MSVIAIATPARDDVKARFSFCLVEMVVRTLQAGHNVFPIQSMGTMLPGQRMQLVHDAKEAGCTHILFVDSDMTFEPDSLLKLMAHRVPVVAANCARRRIPTGPTASRFAADGSVTEIHTEPGQEGLEAVTLVGTGFMLVEMATFDKLKKPYFATPWQPDREHHMGEDTFFCLSLGRAGVPIMIDHGVSGTIGHLGEFEFKIHHAWAQADAEGRLMSKSLIEVPNGHHHIQ